MKSTLETLDEIRDYVMENPTGADIHTLTERGYALSAYVASSGELVAKTKREWQNKKKRQYHTVTLMNPETTEKYGKSNLKDYVASCCAEEESVFLYAERMNSAAVHALDFLRTAISSEKAMLYQLSRSTH